jgi:hypothetical protein
MIPILLDNFFVYQVLTPEEKRFVLLVERGDCASVAKLVKTILKTFFSTSL